MIVGINIRAILVVIFLKNSSKNHWTTFLRIYLKEYRQQHFLRKSIRVGVWKIFVGGNAKVNYNDGNYWRRPCRTSWDIFWRNSWGNWEKFLKIAPGEIAPENFKLLRGKCLESVLDVGIGGRIHREINRIILGVIIGEILREIIGKTPGKSFDVFLEDFLN